MNLARSFLSKDSNVKIHTILCMLTTLAHCAEGHVPSSTAGSECLTRLGNTVICYISSDHLHCSSFQQTPLPCMVPWPTRSSPYLQLWPKLKTDNKAFCTSCSVYICNVEIDVASETFRRFSPLGCIHFV